MRDYLAFLRKEPKDAVQHGVKGMRWGVRRTDAQLAKASSSPEPSAAVKAMTGEESSASRYARLAGEAKGGGSSNWSEQDLKFFNARTEALGKVNKMYAKNPGWLQSTSKNVLQKAAQQTMQDIANGVAKKYVTNPMLDSLSKKQAEEVAAATKTATQKVVGAAASKTAPSPRAPGMTRQQSLDYIKAYQAKRIPPRPGTSPSGNLDLFNQLRAEGLIK